MPEGEVAALVAAASEGDEAAWNVLVARFGDVVWSVARGHGLEACDACDVTQTVWLRLHQQLGRLEEPERLGAWLVTTTRRECLRLLRERQRQVPSLSVEKMAVETLPPADELFLEEEFGHDGPAVREALSRLSTECQHLLWMLVAEPGPSYQMVSDELGMPVGSIGPRRSRCLERLRASLLYPGPPSGENGVGSRETTESLGPRRPAPTKEVS